MTLDLVRESDSPTRVMTRPLPRHCDLGWPRRPVAGPDRRLLSPWADHAEGRWSTPRSFHVGCTRRATPG